MGKKILKLFFETMLRAAVIILGFAIIVMTALLIKTVKANKEQVENKQTTTNNPIATEADDPDDPTFNNNGGNSNGAGDSANNEDGDNGNSTGADGTGESSGGSTEPAGDIKNAKILVINASGTGGVAGSWRETLQGEGYTSVEVGNYLPGILTTTKVCTSGGYDASSLAGKFTSPEMTTVDSLDSSSFDMTVSAYDIVVVVGTNDANH